MYSGYLHWSVIKNIEDICLRLKDVSIKDEWKILQAAQEYLASIPDGASEYDMVKAAYEWMSR